MEKILEITEDCTTLTISIGTSELVEDEELWVEVFRGDPASDEVEKTPYFIVNEWSEEEVTERVISEFMGKGIGFENLIERLYRAMSITEKEYTRKEIISIVCDAYDTTIKEVRSKTRRGDVVEARQMICYLLRMLRETTYVGIAAFINRDHSTAYVSVDVIRDRIDNGQLLVRDNEKLNMLIDLANKLDD